MQSLIDLVEIIQDLNERWKPHDGQIPIGRALFYENCKDIFVCAGRNFGKTELASYCTWRYAQEHPGSENYIFEPYLKQAREILWAGKRIQTFGPDHLIEGINNSELRITFKNGSFIKLEGSDNEAAMAGIKPKGLIIYDEYKDHRLKSINNFEPNRAAFDVPALFIGTPPIIHNHFVDYMELAKSEPDWRFFHGPTSSNPHISRKWLEKKKRELIKLGEEETWHREYEALFVKGGKGSIFPQIYKIQDVDFKIPNDVRKWQLVVGMDPASTSVFGVVFVLFNPYSKKMYLLDEIYETNQTNMTARNIWSEIQSKVRVFKDYGVVNIDYVYDEAAAWFRNEISELGDYWLAPSNKSQYGVEGYINVVRHVMANGLFNITSYCPKMRWELEGYIKDDKGKIPKANDHLINAYQYVLGFLGFTPDNVHEPDEKPWLEELRFHRMEEEYGLNNSYEDLD